MNVGERAATRRHSVDGCSRRGLLNPRIWRSANPIASAPNSPKHAVFSQATSHSYDPLFQLECGAGSKFDLTCAWRIRTRQCAAASALNPRGNGTHAHPKCSRDTPQAVPRSHRLNHLATPFFQGQFLAMDDLTKMQMPYTGCTVNAE